MSSILTKRIKSAFTPNNSAYRTKPSTACAYKSSIPAKTLITERILLEAKRLLVHTMQPIGSIADALAFNEVSNFVVV